MKYIICFPLFFFVASICADPLLVVVIMVKNEASVIQQTLQPFVDGGVKDFLVFDTGSTDGTQEVVKKFFRHHGLINAHIVEEPFVDFSTSRNRALDVAETIFSYATFMFMPDAEWYMHNTEGLLKFCQDHIHDYHDSYRLQAQSNRQSLAVCRLIRCRKNVRFVGRVHEALNQITRAALPDDVYFEWRPSAEGNKKSAQRWHRDRDLLLQDHHADPSNPRTLFYLGQTYELLGDWENAYLFYKKRAEIHGWDEENFMNRFYLGNVACRLISKDDKTLCPLAITHYLEAFAIRPHRAEPLIEIAHYYLGKQEMHLAFLFASRAVQILYPAADVLPVEKWLYDFVRYDILGICAWYVGEYEIGEWAVRKALEADPQAPHLHANLKFYTNRKM